MAAISCTVYKTTVMELKFPLQAILSFSIVFAVIAGWVRISVINSGFIPFIVLINYALISEAASYLLIRNNLSNVVNYNIYGIAEVTLILWQFYRWKLWGAQKNKFLIWVAAVIILWLAEWWYRGTLQQFFSGAILFHSFIIVLFSLQFMRQKKFVPFAFILRDARVIICACFIIFFAYSFTLELFWLYGGQFANNHFSRVVTSVLSIINFFINLVYVLAVLWIPLKHRYIFS